MGFKPLKSGEFLGVVATSSPAKQERFDAAQTFLTSKGWHLKVAGTPCAEYGTDRYLFASAPAKERAGYLTQLFEDSSVGAILIARGAGGVLDVLPLLDYGLIARHAKPVIGFSDSTALLVALRQRSDCPVIHGPHLESFAALGQVDREHGSAGGQRLEITASADQLFALLRDGVSPVDRMPLAAVAHAADVEGDGLEVFGGNLSVITALCGTPWQADAAGKLLFLEDVNEKPHRVHRMLTQLILAGVLKGVRGVLLGSFRKCEADAGPGVERVLYELLASLCIPVFSGVPAGHIPGNTPIPFFGRAEVKNSQLTVYLARR